jgi:hypothetical protein
MTTKFKGSVLLPILNIAVVSSKVPSSLKTTTHEIQLLIPHKQNPHSQINQLAVTAKILSQPPTQMCVTSVAVPTWQTDFLGLHERHP